MMFTNDENAQSLLTRYEAATFLRISVSQLDSEARKGRIARVKLGEGGRARVLYKECDLLEYINSYTIPAAGEPRRNLTRQ